MYVALAFLWVLKFHARLQRGVVLLAALALFVVLNMEIALTATPSLPGRWGGVLIGIVGFQSLRLLRRRRWMQYPVAAFAVSGVVATLAALLGHASPPTLAVATLTVLAGTLLASESLRHQWRTLGILSVPHPALAWLITGLAALAGPYGLALPMLLRLPGPRLQLGATLTPCQATLLLRLPLTVANAALELLPVHLQAQWFRADPTRLHLREPLLETQNAPAYFAELADYLHQARGVPRLFNEEQLAAFCLLHPYTVAEAALQILLEAPRPAGPGWTSNNLSAKPGHLVQLRHLVLLQRIVRAS